MLRRLTEIRLVLPMRLVSRWIIAFLISLSVSAVTVAQDENEFSAAIEKGQGRTVKIVGASVGNVSGYATGILVSDSGDILTGSGVLLTGNRIRVMLADGSLHNATVVRQHRGMQLAQLKIDAKTPDYFDLEKDVVVPSRGEWVVVLANAFKVADGDEPLSVNLGVVSLQTKIEATRGRNEILYSGDLVLIDAITSNPGAAGGAVLNTEGNLIGMVGKIIESNETSTRLNYAVPSEILKRFKSGSLEEPSAAAAVVTTEGKAGETGIRMLRLSKSTDPAYIDRVIPNSPAAMAGLKADDLIVTLAGEKIANIRDFNQVANKLLAGAEVVVVVKRGTQILQVNLTPEEKK